MIDFKEIERRYERDHNIFCPYCDHKQAEDDEQMNGLITYWGEEEDKEFNCEKCEIVFMVKEMVDRTWESQEKV